MRRVAHRLQHNSRSSGHPDDIVVYDTETRGQPTVDNPSVIVELKWGYAIWKRLTRGTRDECEFTTCDEFWDFVEAKSLRKRILWVVAHNAKNFDLAVLEYEEQLTRRGWTIGGTPILPTDGQGPLKVTARKGDKIIILADLANWYGVVPLDKIGKTVGVEKVAFENDAEKMAVLTAEHGDELWDTLRDYGRQDVEVVLSAMEMWISFLKEHDLGNFSISLAGQSMQAFRHRFMTHEIMIHNNEAALELERAAYNGATVDCFRVGEFEGSFHVVDVNSEYPYVMRTEQFPIKLVEVVRGCSLANCQHAIDSGFSVIAAVEIDTDLCSSPSHATDSRTLAIVPTVHDGKLIYPTGRFTATLCTGELSQALQLGVVARVVRMAVYERAAIFVDYVDFFYKLRMECEDRGDTTFAGLAKLFMNALYGKWGQRNYQWEAVTDVKLDKAGVEMVQDSTTGEFKLYRQLGDMCQIRSQEKVEGYNSFPAIAAHATSYARMTICRYRRLAGLDHALYTDTDSLIVDDEGLEHLREGGHLGRELGQLKVEESGTTVRITAPKNYECGMKKRHKGRRKDAVALCAHSMSLGEHPQCPPDGRYRQIQFRGLAGAMRAHDPNHAVISLTVKRGDMSYSKGVVDPVTGWTRPFHLDLWQPLAV